MRKEYDVVVIGSGIAGLTAAIHLKEGGADVVLLTKSSSISDCNTHAAQGGIIASRSGDSSESLAADIETAGCRYSSTRAIESFSEEGPPLVFRFLIEKVGMDFSRGTSGELDYTEEAAHSARRILHYEDHTGDRIEESLIAYAQGIGVLILTSSVAVDLITNNHHSTDRQELYAQREVMGVYVFDELTQQVDTLFSHAVIIATGGIGNLYQHTTNTPLSTGDGISMAYRAGADIINAEFRPVSSDRTLPQGYQTLSHFRIA